MPHTQTTLLLRSSESYNFSEPGLNENKKGLLVSYFSEFGILYFYFSYVGLHSNFKPPLKDSEKFVLKLSVHANSKKLQGVRF